MHRINNAIDRTVARPLALAYVRVVPRPMRLGVGISSATSASR